jgi:hypoxanthine phosphoribosyltransferase
MENISKFETQKKYNHPEMELLEPGMIELVAGLKKQIESDAYDYIVSDDVGGRIPSLVIKKVYKEIQAGKSLPISFISGGKLLSSLFDVKSPKFKEYVNYLKDKVAKKLKKKALLVTEYVDTGSSLTALVSGLKRAKIKHDLAIVYSRQLEDDDYENIKDKKSLLFIGKINLPDDFIKGFYAHTSKLSGVEKGSEAKIHPELYNKVAKNYGLRVTAQQNRKNIDLAREDVDTMARKIINHVWSK